MVSLGNNQAAGGFLFPGLTAEKTPFGTFGETLGVNWHPSQGPKNPPPGPISPHISFKGNDSHLEDKELENIVTNLFNVGAPQEVGVSEKRDLEVKASPESIKSYFGGEQKEEKKVEKKKTEEKAENKPEGVGMQIQALAGIQKKSAKQLLEQEPKKGETKKETKKDKKKNKNNDSANVDTSECLEDMESAKRNEKVNRTMPTSQHRR